MKPNKPTFNKILEQTERENSERLMMKARLANRLAKRSHGTNRQTAYYVKAQALRSLVKKLSGQIRISEDFRLPDFVVVGLKSERSGLHLPSFNLAN